MGYYIPVLHMIPRAAIKPIVDSIRWLCYSEKLYANEVYRDCKYIGLYRCYNRDCKYVGLYRVILGLYRVYIGVIYMLYKEVAKEAGAPPQPPFPGSCEALQPAFWSVRVHA